MRAFYSQSFKVCDSRQEGGESYLDAYHEVCSASGLERLAKWMRARLFITNFRPVPLTEHVVFQGVVYVKVGTMPQDSHTITTAPWAQYKISIGESVWW
jgi:hypothetical protein